MGLKSKLAKMKNFLFDEEEVEKPEKKQKIKKKDKKEKPQEKVAVVEESKVEEIKQETIDNLDSLYFEEAEAKEETIKPMSRSEKKEFNFPEFDDEDFMVATKKPEPIIAPPVVEEEKPILYQGSNRKKKEEYKKFKPTPIISPIYGLLDDSGKKAEKSSDVTEEYYGNSEASIDDVRKKAYGIIDDEMEDTLKKLSNKTIEEAEALMEEDELPKKSKKPKTKETFSAIEVKSESVTDDEDDDDMILPSVNFKEIDVDKERTRPSRSSKKVKKEVPVEEDDDDDTKEQDLFNLIDTMYKEGDED